MGYFNLLVKGCLTENSASKVSASSPLQLKSEIKHKGKLQTLKLFEINIFQHPKYLFSNVKPEINEDKFNFWS